MQTIALTQCRTLNSQRTHCTAKKLPHPKPCLVRRESASDPSVALLESVGRCRRVVIMLSYLGRRSEDGERHRPDGCGRSVIAVLSRRSLHTDHIPMAAPDRATDSRISRHRQPHIAPQTAAYRATDSRISRHRQPHIAPQTAASRHRQPHIAPQKPHIAPQTATSRHRQPHIAPQTAAYRATDSRISRHRQPHRATDSRIAPQTAASRHRQPYSPPAPAEVACKVLSAAPRSFNTTENLVLPYRMFIKYMRWPLICRGEHWPSTSPQWPSVLAAWRSCWGCCRRSGRGRGPGRVRHGYWLAARHPAAATRMSSAHDHLTISFMFAALLIKLPLWRVVCAARSDD